MNRSVKAPLFILLVAISLPLYAERRRAIAPPVRVLSIEFVNVPAADPSVLAAGPDAWVDVSSIGQPAESTARSVRVQRQFAIRILRSGGLSSGTASVTATVNVPDRRCLLRIDGHPLGTTPVIVDARAALGDVTVHTLDIEVPDTVAAGPLAALISWEATSQ